MDYAVDKLTGIIVDARNAISLKKRYKCPTCYADCHLRTSYNKKPHFVHDSGKASDDCENYYTSGTIIKSSYFSRWADRRRLPGIYISCLSDLITHETIKWRVQLLIPECSKGTGCVEITDGLYGIVTIPVDRLNRGGKKVEVLPKMFYQVTISGQVDSAYSTLFDKPISGLDTQICNVFNFSQVGGRKLQEKQALFWGQAYFLVYHKDFEPQWWPRAGLLNITDLSSFLDWHCILIELPKFEDNQVIKWVERILNRDIQWAPLKLSIVSPIESHRLSDGSILLPVKDTLIGVTGEAYEGSSEICVQLPDGPLNSIMINTEELPAIISIGKLPPGRTEVWLSENPEIGISISAFEDSSISNPQGIVFTFEHKQKGILLIPVHSIQTTNYLKESLTNIVTLVGISLPMGIPVSVRHRRNTESKWHEEKMVAGHSNNEDEKIIKHKEFENSICKIIKNRDKNYEMLEIDFGQFGKIHLGSLKSNNLQTYHLSQKSRQQLQWIISILSVYNPISSPSSGEGKRRLEKLLRQVPFEWYIEDDRKLFISLLKFKIVPIIAESHLRKIVKVITKELKLNGNCFPSGGF